MARIRSIKPEFWTSAQVMECSPMARLLFVGMWNFADDAGRMAYSPKTLKAQIYPSDDIKSEEIKGMVDELSSNDLILIYTIDGKEFISISGWAHQKIDKPRASKIPGPFVEASTIIRRKVATDLNGSEGIVSDPIGHSDASGAEAAAEKKEDTAAAVPRTYVFEDGVIRLNARDFETWRKAFSNLDLAAELLSLSKWAESEGGKWFHAVKGALAKRNREVKATRENLAATGGFKWNGDIEGVI